MYLRKNVEQFPKLRAPPRKASFSMISNFAEVLITLVPYWVNLWNQPNLPILNLTARNKVGQGQCFCLKLARNGTLNKNQDHKSWEKLIPRVDLSLAIRLPFYSPSHTNDLPLVALSRLRVAIFEITNLRARSISRPIRPVSQRSWGFLRICSNKWLSPITIGKDKIIIIFW